MDRSPSKLRLLDCALHVFRAKGYTASTVDDICAAAGVTKGSFFHHFKGKEELALEAIAYWNEGTSRLFAEAAYQRIQDPRERLLAYIDFRAALVKGDLPDFTCLLGTLVQDVYETNPVLREACDAGIRAHALDVAKTVQEAKAMYAPNADWDAKSVGLHTQVVIQGSFVLAKARNSMKPAIDSVMHLRNYIEMLLSNPAATSRKAGAKRAQTKESRK
jgi:TetR/AcrR family transcriptional regulator, transcriptional repressor for nem operon